MKKIIIFFISLNFVFAINCKGKTKEEQTKGVYFIEPQDGAEVTNPIKVKMGVNGMEVVPAGELKEGTGHHHIIIDGPDYIEAGQVIPSDENHIHFGNGATETELNLQPGEHTLTLQFADGEHKSYGKDWAKKIKIIVKDLEKK
jgi:hypothetical protein